MPRPFTRRQARQNEAFLAALAETGNARLAARRLRVHRSTYTKRRAKCPAFAARWTAALAAAQANLVSSPAFAGEGDRAKRGGGAAAKQPSNRPSRKKKPARLRNKGGEPVLVRLADGRLQLREALSGSIAPAAEKAFLRFVADTANLRAAAAHVGFAHSSFIVLRRRSPGFAARLAKALAAAPDRIARAERRRIKARRARLDRQTRDNWDVWPAGVTMAQALRYLGAPPLKLPGTPFSRPKPR